MLEILGHTGFVRPKDRFGGNSPLSGYGRYGKLYITAIMHSAQLCTVGVVYARCRLVGSGRRSLLALHNYRVLRNSSSESDAW